jgi:glyoxylase-like metal-dependent hydrolase (beta-lactamase superfamily II)
MRGVQVSDNGIDGSGTLRASCLLAPNPSPMTLDGTNTWVLAEPESRAAVIVDPGPDDIGHARRVAAAVADRGLTVETILLTHHHDDHFGGAAALSKLVEAPVRAFDPAFRINGEGLADGDVVTVGGLEVRVLSTPGHTDDSLTFFLPADGALLTGDTVLGRGTTVLHKLGDYLRSLDRLRGLVADGDVRVILPAHGPVIADPATALDFYISHRRERIAEVTAAIEAGDRTIDEIVARVYADVDRSVWFAARGSVRAQLDYLAERGDLPADLRLD